MHEYDITFMSTNSANYAKPITALVVEPDSVGPDTGLMHFAHGWDGNRFQYQEMQREFVERYNVIGVSTEFRMSGYDFDPVRGRGAGMPYDASHYQVVDCLNALRETLRLYPSLNRRRILNFGGSQGGHVAMLMTVFCPDTFALTASACGISYLDPDRVAWSCRTFTEDELAIRDVPGMAERVACPMVLIHGTADETVPDRHTRELARALRAAGKVARVQYVDGGNHALGPDTNRRDVLVDLADDLLATAVNDRESELVSGRVVRIPCETRTFVLDWSLPPGDVNLLRWEDGV